MDLDLLGSDLTDEYELVSRLFDITALEILFQSKLAFDG
jgi:hypothetical protein